jgi:aspartokinase-like uncharacterized kinase
MHFPPAESERIVVKVGGSLYDWPDLGPRLRAWLDALRPAQALLVPGGGPTADVVRALDRRHALGEEASHWLALQALSLNGRFLQALLPGVTIVDAYDFARQDEGQPGALPHSWDVTSDSVAARVAAVTGARRLVLLKSADFPVGIEAVEAGRGGLVDAYFARAQGNLEVYALNFRAWEPGFAALARAKRVRPGSLSGCEFDGR